MCYKCNLKWSKIHECRFLKLQVLKVVDDCEVEIRNEDWVDTFKDENGVLTELTVMALACFFGLSSPNITKVWGKLGS